MQKITLIFSILTILGIQTSLCQSVAIYDIVFESVWESVDDNPSEGISTLELPVDAHWSPLALVTHKSTNSFLMMGAQASAGIESIAEIGATSTFENEVNTNPDANQVIVGSGLDSAKGTISINNVEVNEDFPLITLASMIAPSPDWFIAVNSENLRSGNSAVNNGWKTTFSLDLYPYDAGTEDGDTYSLSNPATNPIGVISSLSNVQPFNHKKIGTVTFIYNSSSLSTTTKSALKNIKMYPNPARNNVTFSNINTTNLETVEIYNAIGKLIKRFGVEHKKPELNINLNNLSKGIYVVNLIGTRNENYIQKLVVN